MVCGVFIGVDMNQDAGQLPANLNAVQAALSTLCRDVIDHHKRVEIRTSKDEACVLISKDELQSLERALEIYASTAESQRLHDRVADLCELASQDSMDAFRLPVALHR